MTEDTDQSPLQAAISAAMNPEAAEPAEAPVEAVRAAPEPVEGEDQGESPSRQRDEAGKFAKKAELEDAPEVKEVDATDDTPSVSPPKSWKPAARAEFDKLPALVQQEVARRELDMAQGVQQLKDRYSQLAWAEEVWAPHKERMTLAGVQPQQYFSQLAAADDLLRRDFTQGLQMLYQLYGQPFQGPQPQFQAPLPPQLSGLTSELQELRQIVTAQQQEAETRQRQALQSQIDQFASDKPYFGDVEQQMAALIQSGAASGLDDAYDKACWADPEIRGLLIKDQQKAADAERLKAERAKAALAKGSGVSVRGSPTSGQSPNGHAGRPSLSGAISEAIASASGRA